MRKESVQATALGLAANVESKVKRCVDSCAARIEAISWVISSLSLRGGRLRGLSVDIHAGWLVRSKLAVPSLRRLSGSFLLKRRCAAPGGATRRRPLDRGRYAPGAVLRTADHCLMEISTKRSFFQVDRTPCLA